jgi:hypothetical protein
VPHGDDLPVIQFGDDAPPAPPRHQRNALLLPALLVLAAFAVGVVVGRSGRPRHTVVFSNPCPSSRNVSFFASSVPGPGTSGAPVFSMVVPRYSTSAVPGAGRLRPGWEYTVPLPNTRPLGGQFQGQITQGDLAAGTLWFPSELCNG